MVESWTVASVLKAARQYLDQRSVGSARLEAELLLAHSLQVSRFDLYLEHDRPLGASERADFKRLIKTRVSGTPIQYITGRQSFRHLDLKIEPGVFIPRPETELLVDKVIESLGDREGDLAVLEIGTGSGAICLSLAKELERVLVWAVDVSEKSLSVAQANAEAHGLSDQVTFCHGDLFSALMENRKFDLIVANPPYIPTGEIENLMAEVRDFEPRAALDGGKEGTDFYQEICRKAPDYLNARGLLAFEVGLGQADDVAGMLTSGGFQSVAVFQDYNEVDRFVLARAA